jgi:hypothetical protein
MVSTQYSARGSGGERAGVGIAERGLAGAGAQAALEGGAVGGRHVLGVVDVVQRRELAFDVEAADVAVEAGAVHMLGRMEVTGGAAQHVGVGVDARVDVVLGVLRLVQETLAGVVFDGLAGGPVEQAADAQRQQHAGPQDRAGGRTAVCPEMPPLLAL